MKKEGGVNGSHAIEHCPLRSLARHLLSFQTCRVNHANESGNVRPPSFHAAKDLHLMIFGRSQSCFASQFSMHGGGQEKEEGRMDPIG